MILSFPTEVLANNSETALQVFCRPGIGQFTGDKGTKGSYKASHCWNRRLRISKKKKSKGPDEHAAIRRRRT